MALQADLYRALIPPKYAKTGFESPMAHQKKTRLENQSKRVFFL